MTNEKRKGAPKRAPIQQKLINGNTPKSKNQILAEILLNHIGGRERPIKRPRNPSVDRELRGLISERNAAGEDVIINLGGGYFRAGPDDRPAVLEYWMKEKRRAKEITKKADTMMNTYVEMYGGYE